MIGQCRVDRGAIYRALRWGFYRVAHSALGLDPVRVNSGYRCLSRAAVNALTRFRQRKRRKCLVDNIECFGAGHAFGHGDGR